MKILFLLAQIFLLTANLHAQKSKEDLKFYDGQGKPVSGTEKAVLFTRRFPVNDSAWQLDLYVIDGPLIRTETWKDKAGTVKHGRSAAYHENGYLDSIGNLENNLQNGKWYFWSEEGKILQTKVYVYGEMKEVIDHTKDSTSSTTAGPKENEKESSFRGGKDGWVKYLNNNMNYPSEAIKKNISGLTSAMFRVDASGGVDELVIFKSVHFLLDNETLRLIRKSPKWIPGEIDGKKVPTYKIQPLQYALQ